MLLRSAQNDSFGMKSTRPPETKKLIGEMSRALRRHRKKLEGSLKREDCTEDQRRITTAHIQLIMLAEAEVDGSTGRLLSVAGPYF